MLILRKIVLQLGAIFLLITLKTHGGLARSVSKSGQQIQRPELPSRSYEELPKLKDISENSSVTSANHSEAQNSFELIRRKSSASDPTKNSTSGDQNSTSQTVNWDSVIPSAPLSSTETTVSVLNSSQSLEVSQTGTTYGANNSITSDSEYEGFVASDSTVRNFLGNAGTNLEDNGLEERSSSLKDILASIENRTEGSTEETSPASKRESLVEAGRRAIKTLGSDLQKLKKNVDSFKQNLRKLLFESEIGNIQKEDSLSSPKNSSSIVPRRTASLSNESSIIASQNETKSNPVRFGEEPQRNASASSDHRVQSFTKISLAAANMSEASKRVGDFIKQQYWDSKEKFEQNEQEAILSRGMFILCFLK